MEAALVTALAGLMEKQLNDLARYDRIFVIRIDRTEPMIAIGNNDSSIDLVSNE